MFQPFLDEINQALDPLSMKIATAHAEDSGEVVFGLVGRGLGELVVQLNPNVRNRLYSIQVNTRKDAVAVLGTTFTPEAIVYFRTLVGDRNGVLLFPNPLPPSNLSWTTLSRARRAQSPARLH
jgi:hypothetical protein